MTDIQRQILLTVSDGDWHKLGQRFSIGAISHAKRCGFIRQDTAGPLIAGLFTLTPAGEAALRVLP